MSVLVLLDPAAAPVSAVATVGVPTQDVEPPPGEGPEFGKASPVALVVILLLGIATVLLIADMARRIRRVQARAAAQAEQTEQPDGTDRPAP